MKVHQTTIYDIARELNISKSTVSRALTGHPEVKAETRKAVLDLAEKLEYQRNMLSVSLISKKTNLIGIIVPEFNTSFFPQVVIGAQEMARKKGYNIIVSQSNETFETEAENARVMLSSRVDGLLVSISKETRTFEHLKMFTRKGIPVVMFNRVCDEMLVPKVVINDYEAAFRAVVHLIESGKRRIAHLAGPDSLITSRKRLQGYLDALRKYEIAIDDTLVIPYEQSLGRVAACVKELMNRDPAPDGLFVSNDPWAIEAIQTLKGMDIPIPEQVGVVGFSNDYGSDLIEPSLSTVAQPQRLMGSMAMETLLDLIDQDPSQWKAATKELDAQLIIRHSSRLNEVASAC